MRGSTVGPPKPTTTRRGFKQADRVFGRTKTAVYMDGVAIDDVEIFDELEAQAYGITSKRSLVNKDGIPWEYALQVPAFKKASSSAAKENALNICSALLAQFGKGNVKIRRKGNVDKTHAYIKVTADQFLLEKLAEKYKIRLRVNPWMGKGYRAFTKELKRKNVFRHPGCECVSQHTCQCCALRDAQGRCRCMLLLPYQRQLLIKRKIELAFDDLHNVRGGKGLAMALKSKSLSALFPLHAPEVRDVDKNELERKTSGSIVRTETQKSSSSPAAVRYVPSRSQAIRDFCGWQTSLLTIFNVGGRSAHFLTFLREYMGEKISLYFAFLHFYTAWLIPLAVVGFILAIYQYSIESDNIGVPVYAMVVAFWSTLFLEFWARRNAELAWDWDVLKFEEQEKEMETFGEPGQRPELGFYEHYGSWVDMCSWTELAKVTHGDEIEEYVQRSIRDKSGKCPNCLFYPFPASNNTRRDEVNTRVWRLFKEFISAAIIFVCLAGVIAVSINLLVLRLIMQEVSTLFGGAAAGVLQACAIAVLDRIFQAIAVFLNNWENHRTATQYQDRLIAKTFFFQFINSYFSLFYIAFFKGGISDSLFGYRDTCKNLAGNETDSCMTELSTQLTSMMLTRLFIGNVWEYMWPKIHLLLRIKQRILAVQKRIQAKHPTWAKEQVEEAMLRKQINKDNVDVAEKQAHQPPYNLSTYVSGTFYDYSELAIQFGYVTLFAPAFPLGPAVAIISNIVENRNDGFKILLTTQKPDYMGAQNIGTWFAIFRILSVIAVITNACIIAFTSNQIDEFVDDASLSLKIFIALLAEHLVLFVQFLIHYGVPQTPHAVRVEVAEEREVQRVEAAFREYKDYLRLLEEGYSSGSSEDERAPLTLPSSHRSKFHPRRLSTASPELAEVIESAASGTDEDASVSDSDGAGGMGSPPPLSPQSQGEADAKLRKEREKQMEDESPPDDAGNGKNAGQSVEMA